MRISNGKKYNLFLKLQIIVYRQGLSNFFPLLLPSHIVVTLEFKKLIEVMGDE